MHGTQLPGTIELGRPTAEEIQTQLNKIIHSKTFRHASALQRLLQYLIAKAVEDPFAEIKEYTIGTEVFERRADYDPQIDTIVRVQIHRLRLKVKEYYESEGAHDPILVEIPKGHYIPTFELRPVATSRTNGADAGLTASGGVAEQTDHAELTRESKSGLLTRGIVLGAAAISLFALGILLGARWEGGLRGTFASTATAKGVDAASQFWKGFLGNDTAPVVGYADAVYLVDGEEDLFRFRRGASDSTGTEVDAHLAQQFASSPGLVAKAGPLYYEDGNTGTGDLQSVFVLTRLFTQMSVQMVVKRCRLITIDDLQQHNVILLGSPEENDAVAQLAQAGDFVWNRMNVPGPWKGEYVNRHPQPGESATYTTERDPNTQQVRADFALITIQPGAAPGRYIAMLGGLDTSGVAGAAQFVTSPVHIAELQSRVRSASTWKGAGAPPAFQALLRVEVQRGNDVFDVRLISVHMIGSDKGSSTSLSASAQ